MAGPLLCLVMLWLGARLAAADPRADGPGRRRTATRRSASSSWPCWCSRSSSPSAAASAGWPAGSSGPSGRILPRRLARPLGVLVGRRPGDLPAQRGALPGAGERDELRVQREGRRHGGGRGRADGARALGQPGVPGAVGRTSVCRGATSSGRDRRPAELTAFSGRPALRAGPRLRRAGVGARRRRPRRARRPRPGAGRRLRPVGAGGRHHDRNRLGGPGGERLAGVRVQRRHRDGRRCSTPTCPAGCRSWSTRSRRATPAARCSTRSTAPGRSCRRDAARSCTSSARAWAPSAGRPPSAGSPTSRTARTACCGPGRRTSTRCAREHRRRPRRRLAGVAAGRRRRAAPSVSPTRRPTSASPPGAGASRGSSTCRTPPTPSSGGRRNLILSHPDWLRGRARPRRLPEHGVDAVRHVLAGHRRPGVRRSNVPDGHGHQYEADYVNGWAAVAQPPGWTAADTERLRQLVGGSGWCR